MGRRLSKPARHIIIDSDLYKQERASYGTIWRYMPWLVLKPTSDDGLCHWCVLLRNYIAYFHKEVPHTDPDSEIGKRPENRKYNLRLWKKNEYP